MVFLMNLAGGMISSLISVAVFLITGYAFYKLASVRMLPNAWLCFIPFFSLYMNGMIIDSLKYNHYKINQYISDIPLAYALPALAIAQRFYFRDRDDFWCIKLKGILLGLLLIPVIFYTYNGTIGKSPDWINIAIFFISAAVVYIYETRQFSIKSTICKNEKLALACLILIGILFVVFTFITPEIGIFRDPLTGAYGI